MKLLIDVNVGGAISEWLMKAGYDIAEVRSKNPRMPDKEILEWALKEKRIIITTDKDFEKMIWQQEKPHCGLLRLENLPTRQRLDLIRDVFDKHEDDLLSGAIVIATLSRYRIRKPRMNYR